MPAAKARCSCDLHLACFDRAGGRPPLACFSTTGVGRDQFSPECSSVAGLRGATAIAGPLIYGGWPLRTARLFRLERSKEGYGPGPNVATIKLKKRC